MAADLKGVVAKPRATEDDELGDLGGGEPTKVSFEFPKGVNPDVVRRVINKMGDLTAKEMVQQNAMDAGRADYMKNGSRRFRCIVRSLRPGVSYFELYFPDPKDPDKPIRCEGRCDVILEEGLTQYVIDCLNYEHSYRTEEIPADYTKTMGLTAKAIRVPHYSVEVLGEIANPKTAGKIGH